MKDDNHKTKSPPFPNELEPTLEAKPYDDNSCISLHALNVMMVPSILKLISKIHGKNVVILIDGGLTNNFIQTRWTTYFELPIHPSPYMRVTVGNGVEFQCGGTCTQVPLQLGDTLFMLDLLLLPIFGADIVLEVH